MAKWLQDLSDLPDLHGLGLRFIIPLFSAAKSKHRIESVAVLALRTVGVLLATISLFSTAQAGVITFGVNANQFQMEFVAIGNPGNSADTTGSPAPAGSVGYVYGLGKFEVSRDMIEKYNSGFGNANSLGITLADMTSFGGNVPSRPATGVSWNEAARFVNWLNTSTGGFAAYQFTSGGVNSNITPWTASDALDYDASNPFRSKRATYVLPSYNEWYKAAFYDPINSRYYDYPTGSDTSPTAIASGTSSGSAVYAQTFSQGPADINLAGGLSPFGVMGLGGNIMEWDESSVDLSNSDASIYRGIRGASWVYFDAAYLSSSIRSSNEPTSKSFSIGFRVASVAPSGGAAVPEPSMMLLGTLIGLGGLIRKSRMKR